MKHKFQEILNKTILPFFKENNFETKDINSETNKKLGVDSFYFYRIDGDLNRNFYFESNSDINEEKYEFKLEFGVYSYSFNETIGFPINDEPNGYADTFSLTAEAMSADKSYWQSITKVTDIDVFAKSLLGVLQSTFNNHKAIITLDDLLDYYFKQTEYACNYQYMIRYLKLTDKKELLDNYVMKLRATSADGTVPSEWFLKDINDLLNTTELKQKVKNNFTAGIKLPISWSKVLEWTEKNPHTVICGSFEICDNSNNLIQHIVDVNGDAIKHLAIIGTNSADEVFCIWQKSKTESPIVFLGEAGRAKVIANSIEDFIDLLAVGYTDIEIADYNNTPTIDKENEKFQEFYINKFKKEIQKTGAEIIARNTTANSEFFLWICKNDSIWKEWNS